MVLLKSTFGLVIRNRKVHLLVVALTFLAVVSHTLRGQGILIDYRPYDPHSVDHSYATVLEIITGNFIVTDLQVRRCLRGFSCSAPRADPPLSWSKMPARLNLFSSSFSLFNYYLFVEKTLGTESKRYVIDIQLTPSSTTPQSRVKDSKWLSRKVSSKSYIWINYLETLDFVEPIVRDINVFFGKQDMVDSREFWKYIPVPLALPSVQELLPKLSMLRIAIDQEMNALNKHQLFNFGLKKNEVLLTSDPNFKILQISDLHIGQDMGNCQGNDKCAFDIRTLKFIEQTIATEGNVGLVVITGDLIDFARAKHFESAVIKALSPILKSNIPFVFTFGDSEYDWGNARSKRNVLNFVSSLPNCYNKHFVDLDHHLHGLTNGNIKVYYVPKETLESESFDLKQINLNEPDAVVSYLDSEDLKVDASQSSYLYRANHRYTVDVLLKLAFFHHPLPNFRPGEKFKLVGTYNEKHPLPTKTDKQFLNDIKSCGYKVIAVGHEHENDPCIWNDDDKKQILLCYSGVTGESGLTRLNAEYVRRMRLFSLNFEGNEIMSWKRFQDQTEVVEYQRIWSLEDEAKQNAENDKGTKEKGAKDNAGAKE